MLDYESLKGDSSEQHFLSSVELWLFFFFFFFFRATHGISILRNMLENTNLEDKSLEPQHLPSEHLRCFPQSISCSGFHPRTLSQVLSFLATQNNTPCMLMPPCFIVNCS